MYASLLAVTGVVYGKTTHNGKVHGANMGPIWGRQDPGGPHVGPMNFAIFDAKDAHIDESQALLSVGWMYATQYTHCHW